MGMDLVELGMKIEDRFELPLQNEEWDHLYDDMTVIGVSNWVCECLHMPPETPRADATFRCFHSLRNLIREVRGDNSLRVHPQTPLHSILPLAKRKTFWFKVSDQFPLCLPSLERPIAIVYLNVFVSLLIAYYVASHLGFIHPLIRAVAGFFTLMLSGIIMEQITRVVAVQFPSHLTVRSLTKDLRDIENAKQSMLNHKQEEVLLAVRLIVAEVGGLDLEKVRPESHLLYDLYFD